MPTFCKQIKTMEISVIIPVYNKAEYLMPCINSVLCQDFCSFEVVAVDDGSTDDSAELCDAMASGDARLRVIHTENGGVTAARRRGVEASRGRYIMFLDADDRMLSGALAATHKAITESGADEVVGTYRTQYMEHCDSGRRGFVNSGELIADLLATRNSFCMIWGILYRRELLDGCLDTPRQIVEREDSLMQIKVLVGNPRVFFIADELLVYYKDLPNSRRYTLESIELYDRLLRRALQPVWQEFEPMYWLNLAKFYEAMLVRREYWLFKAYYKQLLPHAAVLPLAERIVVMAPPRLARVLVVTYKRILRIKNNVKSRKQNIG